MFRRLTIAALFACTAPAALADAIPPPAQISDVQKLLIGMWHEDSCIMPEGLGHSCLQRVLIFGDSSVSEARMSDMSVSNMWNTGARSGTWTATRPDAMTVKVSVTYTGAPAFELTLQLDKNGFQLTSSEYAMFPASHFTRLGQPIEVSK